jgi:hypothetical protein
MPYASIAKAKSSGFQTTLDKINLTLAQVNYLAKIYDGIKKAGNADEPMAVAIAQFKDAYTKNNDKWVLKVKVESKVVSGSLDFNHNATMNEWVPVAKVGQEGLVTAPDGKQKRIFYSKEALADYVETWKGSGIDFNHDNNRLWDLEEATDAKFEDPYLYMQLSNAVREKLKDPLISGCSVQGIPGEIDGDILRSVTGERLSLMEFPQMPACNTGDGCGVVSSSTLEQIEVTDTTSLGSVGSQAIAIGDEATILFDTYVKNNVGIVVKIGTDTVYGTKEQLKDDEYIKAELMQRGGYYGRDNLAFYPPDTKVKIGDILQGDATPVHTQVKEMVASAVGEVETNLKNQQEVDINALKDSGIKAKEELETKHATELGEATKEAYKKAETITAFKAKYNPSEEVLKEAEELDISAIEFFVRLNIPIQESASGVASGNPGHEEEHGETMKELKKRFEKKLGRGVKEE